MYLPPSYHDAPDHHYPTVYLLHGINGGSREWEPRDFQTRLDELFTTGGLAESIVVMPDGESLWYIDSSVAPWRSMFIEELLPQVYAEYRTLPQREFRGMSGVSMGGHGTFTIGWDNPDLFASLASHMGALDLPPLVGTPAEIAANTPETPTVQVNGHTPEFLSRFSYYMDACEDDDFAFDEALRAMSGQLTTKLVEHTAVVFPEGRHDDDCWLPHIDDSFGLHSDSFRAAGLVEPPPAPPAAERVAGPDRVATAVAVSARGFDSATVAVIASADAFPDALTASVLAGAVEGPLLLSPQAQLPASVAEELSRLGVERVHLAGGEAALSAAVAEALEDQEIAVTRLGGADRHGTAALIAAEVDRLLGGVAGAVLARSDDFPDALGATNLALQVGWPILLSPTDSLSDVTSAALEDLLEGPDAVVLAGGTAALSQQVADQVEALDLTVDRRGGPDRYATARALLTAAAEEGRDIDPAVVASGRAFRDALTAGVLAHRLLGAVLLVDPLDLDASPATRDLLAGAGRPTEVLVAEGTAAVSADVQQQIEALLAEPR